MHRLMASRHVDTFTGYLAIALGVFVAGCLIVGVAVVLDVIAGVVR